MSFTAIHNWRDVLKYAWSLRLIALAAVLSGLEVAIQFFVENPPLPRGVFALLSALVTVAAFFARFVAQKKVSG